jgi:hypothetical protein
MIFYFLPDNYFFTDYAQVITRQLSICFRLAWRLLFTPERNIGEIPTSKKREEKTMKILGTLLLLGSLGLGGCEFVAGAATGALATGAGYEINANRQLNKLEDDYRNERISRREYERRKDQLERGSIIY